MVTHARSRAAGSCSRGPWRPPGRSSDPTRDREKGTRFLGEHGWEHQDTFSKDLHIFKKEDFALLRLPAGHSRNPLSWCHLPDLHRWVLLLSDSRREPALLQWACGNCAETQPPTLKPVSMMIIAGFGFEIHFCLCGITCGLHLTYKGIKKPVLRLSLSKQACLWMFCLVPGSCVLVPSSLSSPSAALSGNDCCDSMSDP